MLMAHRAKITENDRRFIEQIQDVENPEMLLKTIQQAITRLSPILAEAVEQGAREGVLETEYPNETIEFLLSAYTFQCLFGEGGALESSVKATERAKAFISLLERALCAEKDSFNYLLEILLARQ
jgi:hypothetical protein